MPDIVPEKNIRARVTTGNVLLQPVNQSGRREYDCIFMQPGRVIQADGKDSNWLIPADVIRQAVPMFNAIPSYLDHPELFGFGWRSEPKVENLVGVTFNPRWSDENNALIGCIRLYDQEPGSPGAFVGALIDQMLADRERGLEVPPTGLSAVFFQDTIFDEEVGLRITTEITRAESEDFVYSAGAGGYVRAALAAIQPQRQWQGLTLASPNLSTCIGGNTMPATPITNSDPLIQQPAPAVPRLADALAGIQAVATQVKALTAVVTALSDQTPPSPAPAPAEPVTLTPGAEPFDQAQARPSDQAQAKRLDNLTAQVETLTATLAEREAANTIVGMGDPVVLTPGLNGLDQVTLAVEAMFSGVRPPQGVRPLTGIRELYHLLSGDYEMTGLFQEDRVYLANVNCSTMANLTADALNKRIVNEFQQYPRWWEPFTSPEDFASLQDVKWITLGGIGELPTVNEGATYTEMTWDDIQQKDSFVKKGGYLGLTLESIDKDDTRKLQAAPRALAQSAWLTLSKAISAIFTANSGTGPTIYYDDTNTRVLFHASNSNLGSSALSWSSWVATRTAMRQQTEHNSGERLGALTAPKYLLVPSNLEMAAIQYLASAGEPGTGDNDINPEAQGEGRVERLRRARDRVIVVDLWTDADNWAAVADPRLYPSIGLGFRFGRTPEIFSVASPTAGLMFSNDTMPIKVRWFFATGPTDWRGLYKHNV